MATEVVDRVEYITQKGTKYVRAFSYNGKGDKPVKSVLERDPSDGRNRIVHGVYVSAEEWRRIYESVPPAGEKITAEMLRGIIGERKADYSGSNGYFVTWEKLTDGSFKLRRSSQIIGDPEIKRKTLEHSVAQGPGKLSDTKDDLTAELGHLSKPKPAA